MSVTLLAANEYLANFFIDVDDWNESEDPKKTRILNVANRTLIDTFEGYVIPDEAVYEFCGTLAIAFNDTNRLQSHGVAGFSVTGVSSFTFKENNVRTPGASNFSEMIPDSVRKMVAKANGGSLDVGTGKTVKAVVM